MIRGKLRGFPGFLMIDSNKKLLPYNQQLESRDIDSIELVVIHATELPDLAMAREYGERVHYPQSGTGNCGHFYIDRDGRVEQWVELERIAHHVAGHNERSVGIELVNRGRYPDWLDSRHQEWQESCPADQIAALIGLLVELKKELPNLTFIAGHDELDTRKVPASDNPDIRVARKLDPGPDFPWSKVVAGCKLERLPGMDLNPEP